MIERAARVQDENPNSAAWVLKLGEGLRAAVGALEMQHLLAAPRLFEIPGSPFHCRHVLIWENELLPVMDLHALLAGRPIPQQNPLIGVVGYAHAQSGGVQLGSLLLPSIPTRVFVRDDQASELPASELNWRAVAISCFADEEGNAIPILDLSRVFSHALMPLFS
jgi:chemotaxis signal transduction protein